MTTNKDDQKVSPTFDSCEGKERNADETTQNITAGVQRARAQTCELLTGGELLRAQYRLTINGVTQGSRHWWVSLKKAQFSRKEVLIFTKN